MVEQTEVGPTFLKNSVRTLDGTQSLLRGGPGDTRLGDAVRFPMQSTSASISRRLAEARWRVSAGTEKPISPGQGADTSMKDFKSTGHVHNRRPAKGRTTRAGVSFDEVPMAIKVLLLLAVISCLLLVGLSYLG
jgi:hypothetical protein